MGEADLSEVFDAFPVAAAVLSPDLVFVAVNQAYEGVTGRLRDQVVGRQLFEVFPDGPSGQGAKALRASLERVLAERGQDVMALQRYDVEIPDRPGVFEERYWNSVNAPILGSDGEVHLIITRLEEVTDFIQQMRQASARGAGSPTSQLEAMEAELFARARELQEVNQRFRRAQAQERQTTAKLRQAVQTQQRAIADASHDLRGPITGLQTRLQLALTDPDADPKEILQAALQDAERLNDIVSDLLELARLEAGVPTPTEPVDLAGLVEAELAHRTPAVIVTTYLGPGVVVNGSPVRLARLLGNLVANAERHARTRIDISLTATGEHAVLEIIDDGPGIPATERETVFHRFYRRPDARRRDPAGTGLGLPIARQIAHLYGGTLRIADQPTGTRMVLQLPLHTEENGGSCPRG